MHDVQTQPGDAHANTPRRAAVQVSALHLRGDAEAARQQAYKAQTSWGKRTPVVSSCSHSDGDIMIYGLFYNNPMQELDFTSNGSFAEY